MRTVLVTGGNGFLGNNLVKSLIGHYKVIALVANIKNIYRLKNVESEIRLYDSYTYLEDIFSENKIDVVIHLATIYRKAGDSVERMIETNILLPVKLLELCETNNVRYFINTDTFFNNPKYSDYEYLDTYTLSKKHVLDWLKALQKTTKVVNMKIFHLYGSDDSPTKFVPMILQKLRENQPIDLTPGEQIRDFIYVDDVISAYKAILANLDTIESSFIEYEVGTGRGTSIKEFVNIASEVIKSKSNLHFGKLSYRNGEIMESVADNKGLLIFGWKSKVNVYQGVVSIVCKELSF